MSEHTPAIATLLESLATAMAGAAAALSGGATTPVSADAAGTPDWRVRILARGAAEAEIFVGVSNDDARRLAGLVMGLEADEIGDDAVVDALREISGQAIAALSDAAEPASVTLSDVEVTKAAFDAPAAATFAFQLPNDFILGMVLGANDAPVGDVPSQSAPGPQPVPLPVAAVVPVVSASVPATPRNLELLLDIELPLAVRFGQTELTLSTLTRLGPGSVIDLHRSADEPVEIMVGGKMIARGEVVVVEGNYGVRVTEILSTADRIRSLGA